MRAIVVTQPGGPLEVREVPMPAPADDEVLVRVHATAVNRADLLQVAGRYPVPPGVPADIPGLEFAGEVARCGSAVTQWSPGDRVFGIAGGGAYAEYLAVHAGSLAEIPGGLGWTDAAAVPEAFITAHDALITQAQLQPGEAVLIHAVASGVGLAAVQVARWRGAQPYGTTRTEKKLADARAWGMADGVVVRDDMSVSGDAVRRWCGEAGIDVVLDLVGGPYVAAGVEALGPRGRLILVGTIAGGRADVPLIPVLRKRLTIRGTVLRSRTAAEKAEAVAAFITDLGPALGTGAVKPSIHCVVPMASIMEAHRIVRANENSGKVVLTVP